MKKIVLYIEGINCPSCVIDIDGQLEDLEGVKEARTSYHKQQTEVIYDESLLSTQKLTSIVQQAGYTAVIAE